MQATATLRLGCSSLARSGVSGASRRRPPPTLLARLHPYPYAPQLLSERCTIVSSTAPVQAPGVPPGTPLVGHATPQYMDYDTLVDMHLVTRQSFGNRPLFGTKRANDVPIEWLTYKEFGKKVDRCRAALAAKGVVRGDAVAIISNNREEWAVCAYATYSLGAVFVPMYEEQVCEKRRRICGRFFRVSKWCGWMLRGSCILDVPQCWTVVCVWLRGPPVTDDLRRAPDPHSTT